MSDLDIKVMESCNNPLLKRKELKIEVSHKGSSTPNKKEMAESIGSTYSVNPEQVYVFGVRTGFGTNKSVARSYIYNSFKDLKDIEEDYVVAKITEEVKSKINRRTKKQEKNKRLKVFGSERRNMMKKARKNRSD